MRVSGQKPQSNLVSFKFKCVSNNGVINYENSLSVEACFLMVISSDLGTTAHAAELSTVTGLM